MIQSHISLVAGAKITKKKKNASIYYFIGHFTTI